MKSLSRPVFIFPTRRCNLRCEYCSTRSGPEESGRTYVTENWPSVLAQVRAAGFDEVRIAGGEPLIDDTLGGAIKEMYHLGLAYTITTNAAVPVFRFSQLRYHRPSIVWVSFHLESTRPEQTLRRIELLRKMQISVGANIFVEHALQNDSLLSRLCDCGVSRIKILDLTPVGRAYETHGVESGYGPVAKEDVLRALQQVAGRAEVRVELPAVRGMEVGPSTCAIAHRRLPAISDDGGVYPCCIAMDDPTSRVGSLRSESLGAILSRTAVLTRLSLPCSGVLPGIQQGDAACPLGLRRFPSEGSHTLAKNG